MKLWRNQPDHDNWRKPSSNREKAGLYFGISVMFVVITLSELHSPTIPPFSGRYSWLISSLYQLNNNLGILGFYILVALIFFTFGISKWLEK